MSCSFQRGKEKFVGFLVRWSDPYLFQIVLERSVGVREWKNGKRVPLSLLDRSWPYYKRHFDCHLEMSYIYFFS